MPLDIANVSNCTDLIAKLRQTDISVPEHAGGRTRKHIEAWIIARLLATLASSDLLDFPLSVVIAREKPDILLQIGTLRIGVEITRVIDKQFAAYCVYRERKRPRGIIDPGHFRPGKPPLTRDELRRLPQDRLTSEGWGDDGAEHDWASLVQKAVNTKLDKLARTDFEKFDQNWLTIYFDMPLRSVDLTRAITFLQAGMNGCWSRKPGFDVLFVEHQNNIARITANGSSHLPLNDLWKCASP
jgi:hypothetical protein